MTKYTLHVTLSQGATQDTLCITGCLVNVNNICNSVKIAIAIALYEGRTTKWVIHDMLSLNLFSMF